MKRIKFVFCFFSVALTTIAQTSTENYILTRTYTSDSGTSGTYLDQIQYFDGLGRPVQTVQRGITPGTTHYDLATYTEYDNAGRETKQWLPIVSSGGFVNLSSFNQGSSLYNNDSHAYTETHYEASPLNRADWQQGPGSAWIDNKTRTTYDTNVGYEVRCFTVSNYSLDSPKFYDPGSLYKTTVTDEDGNPTTEYKDKLGHVVLKRAYNQPGGNHDTYYVYNDLVQLCFVLPPYAADASGSPDAVDKYGYVYRYDERGNCTYKKLPGCQPINMTYYSNDLLKTSQDGNQLAKNEKLSYVYDGLNRLVTTSLEVNSVPTVLTENYYDNYNFTLSQPNLAFVPMTGYDGQYSSAKGLLTGTRTRILDNSNTYIYSAIYYDYRGLPVQTRSTNHLGGYDIVYNAYDFTGHITKNLKVHSIPGQAAINELYDYGYDHAGRLMTVTYQLNDKTPVVLASNTYDDLGRLVTKQRHGGADNEAFEYNLRNWPTKIKSGAFEENLYYNSNPIYSKPYFNGNISYQTWTYKNNTNAYVFTYDNLNRLTCADYLFNGDYPYCFWEYFYFDKMGNITYIDRGGNGQTNDYLMYWYDGNKVTSIQDDFLSQNQYSIKEYQDKSAYYAPNEMTYDANGNLIKDLDRDIYTIKYNYLNLPEIIQFKNGNQILNSYDASGKKLSCRYYNILLRSEVPLVNNLQPGQILNLEYNMDIIDELGTFYVDNIEYNFNGCDPGVYMLDKVYNSEGYSNRLDISGGPFYQYYHKDHLGNIREVWSPAYTVRSRMGINRFPASVIQYTQYYPSGLPWASNSGDNPALQNKKYNGKEFIEMNNYDTYDYGARGYYPAIGRFTTVDPLAEKYYSITPYAYCAGNPVNMIDPDGKQVLLGGPALNIGMKKVVATIINNSDLQDGYILGSAILSPFTGNEPSSFEITTDELGVFKGVVIQPVSSNDIEAAKSGLLLPIISGSAVNKIEKSIEKVIEGGRAGKTIVKENGVIIKSYGTNDAHKPAHAHVLGGGKDVRVGPNGKPLKGQPELTDKQKKVIDNNRKEIRKEVNAVGKENKKIEELNLRK